MASANVFLLASKYLELYKDIIEGLEGKGYNVFWVEDDQIANNPFKIKYNTQSNDEEDVALFEKQVESYWVNFFAENQLTIKFDYFLVIDGLMVCPWLFTEMRRNNPNIHIILYLFDRVEGMYQIDRFFQYYDKIFSFDDNDVKQFNLEYLPIYWCPKVTVSEIKYDIFGLAAYNHINPKRNEIYRRIKNLSDRRGLREYIRLYYKNYSVGNQNVYIIKSFIKRILGRNYIPLSFYKSGLVTTKAETPSEFRNIIAHSKCILDVQPDFQAGFTARFMWALGLGKKIITTNQRVSEYPFYDEEQFFVLTEHYREDELLAFVKSPYIQSEKAKRIIEQYRIDNWLNVLVG